MNSADSFRLTVCEPWWKSLVLIFVFACLGNFSGDRFKGKFWLGFSHFSPSLVSGSYKCLWVLRALLVTLGFPDSPGDFWLSGFDPNDLDTVSLAKPLPMDLCCCCCCAFGEIRELKRCLWQCNKDIE